MKSTVKDKNFLAHVWSVVDWQGILKCDRTQLSLEKNNFGIIVVIVFCIKF